MMHLSRRPDRLSQATLDRLPAAVERPGYDRRRLVRGVVHIGPGAFHRAHQAVVFDDLARAGDIRWGVTAIALRSQAARAALEPQDGLYTLNVRDAGRVERRVIGSIGRVIGPDIGVEAALEAIAEAQARLVTLTITEAGYVAPSAAATCLAQGLAVRRRQGVGGLTVLACDNLQANGARLRALVTDAARELDPDLAAWIGDEVAFPNTMVDRITPATSASDIAELAQAIGVVDEAMVCTEPFSQWVIEDRFARERPDFASVGVTLVADVAPFERAKLRLLNGAHSAMAWLGGLAGLTFVHEFVTLPAGRAFVERLWDEVAGTLSPTTGIDLAAYRASLLARFANSALPHRLDQIAADSSQKIGPRLLEPLAERRAQGQASPALVWAVAAWIAWLSRRLGAPDPPRLIDPLATDLIGVLTPRADPLARVEALIGLRLVDSSLRTELAHALGRLERLGPFVE